MRSDLSMTNCDSNSWVPVQIKELTKKIRWKLMSPLTYVYWIIIVFLVMTIEFTNFCKALEVNKKLMWAHICHLITMSWIGISFIKHMTSWPIVINSAIIFEEYIITSWSFICVSLVIIIIIYTFFGWSLWFNLN